MRTQYIDPSTNRLTFTIGTFQSWIKTQTTWMAVFKRKRSPLFVPERCLLPEFLETHNIPECAYPPKHPHERFLFMGRGWDIGKAWGMILRGRKQHTLSLPEIDRWHDRFLRGAGEFNEIVDRKVVVRDHSVIQINVERALSEDTDLSVPVLFGTFKQPEGECHMLLDGWHRLHKAWHMRQSLQCFILTERETRAIEL